MTHEQWIKMTPEEQRIKVAELCEECGIRLDGKPYDLGLSPDTELDICKLPDYLNDLNAMHEAEQRLTRLQAVEFRQHLFDMMGKHHEEEALHATAAQRAEAFVMTMEEI